MLKRVQFQFTLIILIIGFMIAVQYNTVQKPEARDTRDVWDIRQELSREMHLHSELLKQIRSVNETLTKYENLQSDSPEAALRETIEELRESAGLTDYKGPGVIVTVRPSVESMALGEMVSTISPDLLIRFLNETNRLKGHVISIDGKRITEVSAIRDINGKTTVNGLNVKTPPFHIKIGTRTIEEAKKLYNFLQGSAIKDDFFIDNLTIDISEPVEELTIPAYDQPIENKYLSEVEKGE